MSTTLGKAIATGFLSAAILAAVWITKTAEPLWAGFFIVWIWGAK